MKLLYLMLSAVSGIIVGIAIYNSTGEWTLGMTVGWWCFATGAWICDGNIEGAN